MAADINEYSNCALDNDYPDFGNRVSENKALGDDIAGRLVTTLRLLLRDPGRNDALGTKNQELRTFIRVLRSLFSNL